MFIDVKPKVGEQAMALTPLIIKNDMGYNQKVIGIISKIDKNDLISIHDYNEFKFPMYRVISFTFGGIAVPNPEFDEEKIMKEDEKIANDHGYSYIPNL